MFEAQRRKITWGFEGVTIPAEATIKESRVLQVAVKNDRLNNARENVMTQIYNSSGIGDSFISTAIRRFQVYRPSPSLPFADALISDVEWKVFGSVDPTQALASGGSYLASSTSVPAQFGKTMEPGVYVQGIWVRESPISDVIMSFSGGSLSVNSRDR